jgi:hypothetical protein
VAGKSWTGEGGTNGATVGAADSGNGDVLTTATPGTGGTLQYDTTHAAHGTKGVKVATGATSTSAYMAWGSLSYATMFARVNALFTALPTASAILMRGMAAGSQKFRVSVESADGKIHIRDAANSQLAVTANTVQLNAFVSVRVKIVAGASAAWYMHVYNTVDGVTVTETFSGSAGNFTAGNFDEQRFGTASNTASVVAYWLDDLAIDDTTDVGPALITISPAGLAIPAAYGQPALTDSARALSPAGLAIALGLGAPALADSARSIAPAGVAVQLGIGQPTLVDSALTISPAGLALPVDYGTPALSDSALVIAPAGLAIPFALGEPATVDSARTIAPAGLVIGVQLGQPAARISGIAPAGLAIGVQLGQPAVDPTITIAPAGLALPFALGEPAAAIPSVAAAGLAIALGLGEPTAVNVASATERPETIPTDRPATVGTARPATVATPRPGTE